MQKCKQKVTKLILLVKDSVKSMRCIQFVCVEVLRPSQPNGVMWTGVNLPNHTFTGQA